MKDFKDADVQIVAIGPQGAEESKSLGLPFRVLSDPGLEVTKLYGLVHPGGYLGRDVPRPTTVLVHTDGTVRWIRAARQVRTRPTPDEVLEKIRP